MGSQPPLAGWDEELNDMCQASPVRSTHPPCGGSPAAGAGVPGLFAVERQVRLLPLPVLPHRRLLDTLISKGFIEIQEVLG